jgi:hypothetical protein
MSANVIVVVERQFDYPRPVLLRGRTKPRELSPWRGSPGWHVETEIITADNRHWGRHHVKTRDNDPSTRVTTDGIYTKCFDPDVFASSERITGDPAIDPDVAGWHGESWEKELTRLHEFLDSNRGGTR